jgi:hypothetical protein
MHLEFLVDAQWDAVLVGTYYALDDHVEVELDLTLHGGWKDIQPQINAQLQPILASLLSNFGKYRVFNLSAKFTPTLHVEDDVVEYFSDLFQLIPTLGQVGTSATLTTSTPNPSTRWIVPRLWSELITRGSFKPTSEFSNYHYYVHLPTTEYTHLYDLQGCTDHTAKALITRLTKVSQPPDPDEREVHEFDYSLQIAFKLDLDFTPLICQGIPLIPHSLIIGGMLQTHYPHSGRLKGKTCNQILKAGLLNKAATKEKYQYGVTDK